MNTDRRLESTAAAMVEPPKGILAIDETVPTCTKRFAEHGIESTEDSRRAYRELLALARGAADYISAVILQDETIRQATSDRQPFPEALKALDIIPGIKVDLGTRPMADSASETITAGLDDLPERLAEYREMGARFAKWRAVIRVGAGLPSRECVRANAEALGRYAVIAQETGLVPIVEPEVLMDGDHDIECCREVTESVLGAVFDQLRSAGCMLTGIVLKPNMVTPGSACPIPADPSQVADLTLAALRRCVPAGVPGIAFLSGGQSGGETCANLNEMARRGPHPWQLSFSFGRALQYPALQIWDGKPSNIPVAQSAFLHRARMSSLAAAGQYSAEAERALI